MLTYSAAVLAAMLASGAPPVDTMVDAIARELAALVPDKTKAAGLIERIDRFVELPRASQDALRSPVKPPPMPRVPPLVSNPDADRIEKLKRCP